jgi:outer membrane protein TolC
VARTYVGLRASASRFCAARRSVDLQQEIVVLTRQLETAGKASDLDVQRAESQLEAARTAAASLNAEVEARLDALAVLAGAAPGRLDAALAQSGPTLLPPASVSVGDPAAMLRRRPDVRAAERRLAAETAGIGVATAARFPRVTLLGVVGVGGTRSSDLTRLDDFITVGAPTLQWNMQDFGRSAAGVQQAEARRDEAGAQYQAAVLAALQDAEGALSRFRAARSNVATLARASASARWTADLVAQRYRAGQVSKIEMLAAERERLSAEDALSTATAALTTEYIAIQKALAIG